MKISPLIALITVGITCYATAGPGGGGGGGAAGGGSASGGSASGSATGAAAPMSPATAPGTTPTAPPNTPATTSQQLIQRNQNQSTAPNSPFSPAVTNMPNTNQFGMNTNDNEEEEEEEREHRHHHHDTNEMSPTGANSGTNQFRNNFVFRDQALTPADQSLLVTLRQTVQTQLGITATGTMPVHFVIDNGVVTLFGTVPSADESQRILLLAQQTAGVTQVVDHLRVGTADQFQPRANGNNNTTQTGTAQTGATQSGTQITCTTQNSAIGGTATDHAFSPSDKALLLKVQQQASQQTGFTPANGQQLPVHFSIQNGVVAITGQVASPQQKQMVAGAVQNVPGVVRVVDDMSVSQTTPTTTAPATTANPAVNNQLAPTSTDGQTNNTMFQNSTNQ